MLGVVAGSMAFCVVAICIALFYFMAIDAQDERIREQVRDIAKLTATVVDVETHQQLRSPEQTNSPLHRDALAPLVEIHQQIPELHYLYTMIYQGDREFFILDSAQDPRIGHRADTEPSAIMEEFINDHPKNSLVRQRLESGETYVFPGIYEDDFGCFISAVAPLTNAEGQLEGFVGVDYRVSAYEKQLAEFRNTALLCLLVGGFGSILLGMLSCNQRRQSLQQVERKIAAEAAMRTARDKAEAALHAKQELLSIAAHDLKNPLAAIVGVADMMGSALTNVPNRYLSDTTRKLFIKIPHYADNMLRIIEEVLRAERIEKMGMHVGDKPFNVTEVANEVVEFNRFNAHKKNITIHYVCERAYSMLGDRDRIMEAFDNLLSNAVKYSPPDSRIDVALGCDLAQTSLRYSVTDEGPGLSDEDQRKLFQKFQKLSAQPTAGESSSGLGLSIVKHVVEAHGGSVSCESEEGFGATFIIELPIVNARPLYEDSRESPRHADADNQPTAKPKAMA